MSRSFGSLGGECATCREGPQPTNYLNLLTNKTRGAEKGLMYKGPPHRRILHAMHGEARALSLLASERKTNAKELRDAARKVLDEAETRARDIPKVSLHMLATLALGKAYIAFDEQNYSRARTQAVSLLDRCNGYPDPVLLSRIHLLLSKVALSLASSWGGKNFRTAEEESDVALSLAKQGKQRRSLARAYLAKAEIALVSTPGPGGYDRAHLYLEHAATHLPDDPDDVLRDELNQVRAKVKDAPPPIRREYHLAELYNKKIEAILEELKGEIIQRTQHMYSSETEMIKGTGASRKMLKKYTVEGKYKEKEDRNKEYIGLTT